jgi:hypothetical protein
MWEAVYANYLYYMFYWVIIDGQHDLVTFGDLNRVYPTWIVNEYIMTHQKGVSFSDYYYWYGEKFSDTDKCTKL